MIKCSYFLLVAAALSTNLFSQDFNLTGAGARAEGFGGAFIGLADDATAVVWNPAGLTQLERAEGSFVTRYNGESSEFKNSDDPTLNDKISQGHFSLNFGSFALPLSTDETKIVAAVAFQRQLDFYSSVKQRFEFVFNSQTYVYRYGDESRGGVNTITSAVSAKLSSMISLGLSANIWTGNLDEKSYDDVENLGRDDYKFDRTYSGLNFVVGGLVDFESMQDGFPLKVGAIVRTPFTLKADGSNDETGDLLLNGSDQYTATADIQMPLMVGFGTSYRMGDNFTLAIDYEIRNYGSRKIKYEYVHKTTGKIIPREENISDSKKGLNELRFGGEYLIVLDNGVIPLRAGFKTVPTTLADYNVDGTVSGNQVSGTGIAVGSGYIADTFAFDVTYGHSSFTQKRPDRPGENVLSRSTVSSSVIIYF